MMRSVRVGAIALLLMVAGVACGGDGDDTESPPASTAVQGTATEDTDSSADDSSTNGSSTNDQPSGAASGGAGTLALGDEVIELERAQCFLEEQDASAGGGKILFTAQGFGTTADGEDFVLDISRFDEDSQFTGDDILVDVGDPRGGDFYSWAGTAALGTIDQDGSTLRAEGLTFAHSEDGSEIAGAFEVHC